MQLADLTIDQPQQQTEQLVRTYTNILNADGDTVEAVNQFESECQVLLEEGWRLKQVSHKGSIMVPQAIIATYAKEEDMSL
jgi:hypothetical protein